MLRTQIRSIRTCLALNFEIGYIVQKGKMLQTGLSACILYNFLGWHSQTTVNGAASCEGPTLSPFIGQVQQN